ncbi:MAG: malonate decarboxylase holo-ACP synthase [Planctomycetaceae bacterium]|nr:malonate decarboxylase holo-ACP synthase [Planctomycetaceae bacterium]
MQQLPEIVRPEVHDLLQLNPDSLDAACIGSLPWVKRSLSLCPWVVVRRAQAPPGQIAVGVRGSSRSERWGSFLSTELITRVVSPTEFLTVARLSAHRARTPALDTLQRLMEQWCDLTLAWGPTGSVGFELATGRPVTTSHSDLDIAIRAPHRIAVEQGRSLRNRATGLQTRVDIRVETPNCGFSLKEYLCASSARILLRCADGLRLGDNPWSEPSTTVETTP